MNDCSNPQYLDAPQGTEPQTISFDLDLARRRRRVRERLQKIMADLARERQPRPYAGG